MKKGIIIVNNEDFVNDIEINFPDWLVVYSQTNIPVQFIAKP